MEKPQFENLDAIVDRLRSLEGYRAMLDALPPDTMHAEPETMLEFLARLRASHDSIEAYARHVGLAGDAIDRLRDRLLVTDRSA